MYKNKKDDWKWGFWAKEIIWSEIVELPRTDRIKVKTWKNTGKLNWEESSPDPDVQAWDHNLGKVGLLPGLWLRCQSWTLIPDLSVSDARLEPMIKFFRVSYWILFRKMYQKWSFREIVTPFKINLTWTERLVSRPFKLFYTLNFTIVFTKFNIKCKIIESQKSCENSKLILESFDGNIASEQIIKTKYFMQYIICCIFYFTFAAQLANMVIHVYALKDRKT